MESVPLVTMKETIQTNWKGLKFTTMKLQVQDFLIQIIFFILFENIVYEKRWEVCSKGSSIGSGTRNNEFHPS